MPTLPRDRLILRLNEIYHDLENRAYDGKHPDISDEEVPRWRRLGGEMLAGPRGAKDILDLGTGTGFVPLRLLEFLLPADRLTVADLSAEMLAACRANLEAAGAPCPIRTLKLDGERIDLPDASQDVVTVNAVMHHLADPALLCGEIRRVLRPGGSVLIGHEPNAAHFRRRFLAWNYWLVLPFADWKLFGYEIILRLGLFEALRGPLSRAVPELRRHNELLREVNEMLMAEGAIDRPLPAAELSSLLDAQSPTAGGLHADRGFTREGFQALFPGFDLEHCETYKHLNKIHPGAEWLRRYDGWLARRFPADGSSLTVRLRKRA